MLPETSDNDLKEYWEEVIRNAQQDSLWFIVVNGIPPMLGLLFYGGYLVLYGISLNVIIKRKRENYWVNSIIITSLFIVATSGVAMNTVAYILREASRSVFDQLLIRAMNLELQGYPPPPRSISRKQIAFLYGHCLSYNKVLTLPLDMEMLPHLERKIHNNSSIFPILHNKHCFVAIILYRPDSPPTRVAILLLCFIAGGIVTNVSLTLLIAGRIIYISKGVEGFCTSSAKKKYRTVISATLESGLIYPLILVLYGSLMIPQTSPQGLAVAVNILYSMVPSIMGIASTLVIVRAAVGISIQDEQSFRSTILGEAVQFQVPRVSGDTIDTEGEGNEVIVDLRSQGHGKVSGQECPMLFQTTQR
ncbi:hypothetical protein L218DRAFT_1042432 [Marasmius fiardii PR-910]|nr:hypothetical protein L218DRAFT_1042432 [Marasmius fiardii PR-910]